MKSNKTKTVWIIERDWKGNFQPKEVLESETKNKNIKTFSTEEACHDGISEVTKYMGLSGGE